MNWLKSMRPLTGIQAGILTLLCFKISSGEIAQIAVYLSIFVSIGAAATMVLNDWCDRRHDLKKGKCFAYEKGKKFLFFTTVLWCVVLSMAVWIWINYPIYTVLSIILILLGVFYFLARHVVGLSAVVVALAGSLPVMFSYQTYYDSRILVFGIVVFLLMLGRETVKDLQDLHDVGYKKTIPVVFGDSKAKLAITLLFLLIVILVGFLHPWLPLFAFIGISIALYFLYAKDNKTVAKRVLDATSFLVLGFLFI